MTRATSGLPFGSEFSPSQIQLRNGLPRQLPLNLPTGGTPQSDDAADE